MDTYHQYFVYLERDKETLEEALHKGLIDWEETKLKEINRFLNSLYP